MKNINTTLLITIGLFLGLTFCLFSQQKEIPIWSNIPNSIKDKDYQAEFRVNSQGKVTGIKKVINPSLKIFLTDNKNINNTAIIICPGGGYSVLSHIKEGDKIAEWFNSIGVSAFVLKYRLPSDIIMSNKTIGPLQDVQEAIRTIRRDAKDWNINPNKIGVIGFSAGGHLAATASTLHNYKVYDSDETSARPDFSMLIYPVISMLDSITHHGSKINLLGENPSAELIEKYSSEKQVNENTPPTILIHATDDDSVPVENSINYYLALKRHKVSTEMHLYEKGGHGFGLGRFGTHISWTQACEKWLRFNELIP